MSNNMNENIKFYGPFVLMLLITVGWAVFFYFVSPTTVVEKVGIQNSYLIVFVLGVICGFSSFTSSTFYIVVIAAASGGSNPLIVGLCGGVGLCISDSAFYFVVSKGTHIIDKHWKKLTNFLKKWMKWLPDWIVYSLVFLYSAFVPMPNDIMLVTLAISEYPFKKISPFLFIGDISSVILLAYISH